MSDVAQFGIGGQRATASIINYFSSGGVSLTNVGASASNNARELLSGALTATTLKSLLSFTGAGRLPYLAAYSKDTTARTVRLRVCVDGVTSTYAFDATTDSMTVAGKGLLAAGAAPSNATASGAEIVWNISCEIWVASSVTETDKVAIAYQAETKQ